MKGYESPKISGDLFMENDARELMNDLGIESEAMIGLVTSSATATATQSHTATQTQSQTSIAK